MSLRLIIIMASSLTNTMTFSKPELKYKTILKVDIRHRVTPAFKTKYFLLTTINSAGKGNFILSFNFSLMNLSKNRRRMQIIPVTTAPGTDSVMFLNINMYVCKRQIIKSSFL